MGAVNIAEASPFFSFFRAVFAWLTYGRFGSFAGATEAVISGVSIGVLVGAIAGFVAGAISKGGIERAFRIASSSVGSAVSAAVFGVFIYPHVTSSTDTTIGFRTTFRRRGWVPINHYRTEKAKIS